MIPGDDFCTLINWGISRTQSMTGQTLQLLATDGSWNLIKPGILSRSDLKRHSKQHTPCITLLFQQFPQVPNGLSFQGRCLVQQGINALSPLHDFSQVVAHHVGDVLVLRETDWWQPFSHAPAHETLAPKISWTCSKLSSESVMLAKPRPQRVEKTWKDQFWTH